MPTETMFVGDVVEEHARVLHEAERRMRREELLEEDGSQEFDAAQFAANGPQVCAYMMYKGWFFVCLRVVRSS